MASAAVSLVSKSLQQYIEKVWAANGNKEIGTAGEVYKLYGESNLTKAALTWDVAEEYANALLDLQRIGGSKCALTWQTRKTRGKQDDEGWVREQKEITSALTTMKAEAVGGGEMASLATYDLLSNDFMHFLNLRVKEATTERIYIHVKPPIPRNGYKVMRALIHLFPTVPQLKSAKICAACATDRVDSIVVYLTDSGTADELAAALGEAPALNGCFERGVPLVVKEVSEGIGRVQEPPVTTPLYADDGVSEHPLRANPKMNEKGSRFLTEKTSFGTLHAELIFTGLKRWRAKNPTAALSGKVPDALFAEIVAAYASEHINPETPEQFPNRQKIERDFQDRLSAKAKQLNPNPKAS